MAQSGHSMSSNSIDGHAGSGGRFGVGGAGFVLGVVGGALNWARILGARTNRAAARPSAGAMRRAGKYRRARARFLCIRWLGRLRMPIVTAGQRGKLQVEVPLWEMRDGADLDFGLRDAAIKIWGMPVCAGVWGNRFRSGLDEGGALAFISLGAICSRPGRQATKTTSARMARASFISGSGTVRAGVCVQWACFGGGGWLAEGAWSANRVVQMAAARRDGSVDEAGDE